MKKTVLVTLAILLFTSVFAQNIPPHNGYVNDFANILSPQTETALAQTVLAYEKQSSIEIAIVTVNDLQGTVIEDYSMKLATQWGIGKKETNNGLLLFVSIDPSHRGFRIEVGYGLEERMTDADARRITRSVVDNYFKRQNFDEGMTVALNKVIEHIGPESKVQYEAYKATKQREKDIENAKFWDSVMLWGIFVLCLAVICAGILYLYHLYQKRKLAEQERQSYETQTKSNKTAHLKELQNMIAVITPLEKDGFFGAGEAAVTCYASVHFINNFNLENRSTTEYADIQKAMSEHIAYTKKIVDTVKSNRKVLRDIVADNKKFTNAEEVIARLMAKNVLVAEWIDAQNPKSVWTQTDPKVPAKVAFTSAQKYAKQCEDLYAAAVSFLYSNKFDKANDAHKGAHVYLEKAIAAVNYPIALKKEITSKEKEVKSMMSQLDELEKKATASVDREHVNITTKKLLDEVPAKWKDIKKAQGVDMVDYFILFAATYALYELLTRIDKQANQDIQSYHDAVRRKKEEEERRRQDEEDDARRRRQSSESSYSYSGGGSVSVSSFGGGSFGGGGATSTW